MGLMGVFPQCVGRNISRTPILDVVRRCIFIQYMLFYLGIDSNTFWGSMNANTNHALACIGQCFIFSINLGLCLRLCTLFLQLFYIQGSTEHMHGYISMCTGNLCLNPRPILRLLAALHTALGMAIFKFGDMDPVRKYVLISSSRN